jgi:hypothetical protein
MLKEENLWHCTNCAQTSKRPWNLRVHIQRKHGGIGQPVRVSDLAGHQYSTSNSTMNGQNKTTPINPYVECDRIQKFTEELVELKNVLSKRYLKEDVAQVIDICCADFVGSGNDILLKSYLKLGRRWDRFLDKIVALEQGMPNANISKMLNIAFTQAINKVNQVYPSQAYFRYKNQINRHHSYFSQEEFERRFQDEQRKKNSIELMKEIYDPDV